MQIGFNLNLHIVWWELGLVVLWLIARALAPALCVWTSKKSTAEKKSPTPTRVVHNKGRGRGRNRAFVEGRVV